ncbi:MAG: response regulator [Bryobacteraceae bacterium]
MKTILIADDNAVSRELTRECLDGCGFALMEASNGREALHLLKTRRPDLALLDIQMPEMDGYAVIRAVRADPDLRGLPVIAITAFAMEGDSQRAVSAGFDAYITKPIRIDALRQEIQRLLGYGAGLVE